MSRQQAVAFLKTPEGVSLLEEAIAQRTEGLRQSALEEARAEFAAEDEVMRRAALLQLGGQLAAAIERGPNQMSATYVADRAIEIAKRLVERAWGEAKIAVPTSDPPG